MNLHNLLKRMPQEADLKTKPRSYFNHSIQFKESFSAVERVKMLEEIGLNVFFFPSKMISGCDLLSDSGTTTMTSNSCIDTVFHNWYEVNLSFVKLLANFKARFTFRF